MVRRLLLHFLLAFFFFCPQGCVRAGFGAGAGGAPDGAAEDTSSLPDADGASPTSDHGVGAQHDTCTTPFLADMEGLTTAAPFSFYIDPALFNPNYTVCGAQRPDLAVHLVNASALVRVTCLGGGQIDIQTALGGAANCSAAVAGTLCLSVPCDSVSGQTFTMGTGDTYLIASRDAAEGPATLQVWLQP